MTHVLAYFRQSDEEGAKKQLSIPAQQERFLQDVAGRDVTYEMAPWDEGYSGGSLDRPGLQWVLANLDRADELWVYDHDRLVRHPFFGPYLMNEIRSRGIRLWGPWGEDVSSPMGHFMTDVRMRFGAYFREEVAERTRVNTAHRLKEGLWTNHAPTGYKFVFEDGEGSRRILVPDPETAPKIKQIFGLMAAGYSQKQAASAVNSGPTTLLWQRDNPLYIGLVYQGRGNVYALEDRSFRALWTLAEDPAITWIYPGRHEPLIDAVTWDRMQVQLASRPPRQRSEKLALSGCLRCECGRALRVHHNSGGRSPSFRCDSCKWERSYPNGEALVVAALAYIANSDEYERAVDAEMKRRRPPDEEDRLAALTRRRAQVARKLDRAIDAMLDAPEVGPALRERAAALQEDLDAIDHETAEIKAAIRGRVVSDWRQVKAEVLASDMGRLWDVATMEEKRTLLSTVFANITATPEVVRFAVRGQPFPIEGAWSVSTEVAGPGFEPGTP